MALLSDLWHAKFHHAKMIKEKHVDVLETILYSKNHIDVL